MKYDKFSKLNLIIIFTIVFMIISSFAFRLLSLNRKNLKNKNNVTNSKSYFVNKNGQTYGYDIYSSKIRKDPDLIQAIGVNGTLGYIKSSDIGPSPRNPKEALEQQKRNGITKTINLYDKDGEKIIDKFQISNQKVNYMTSKNKK